MDEQYFTVREIAQRLNFQEHTIRLEIRAKKLRAIRIRGEYRISNKDLATYLRSMATIPSEDEVEEELQVAC
jgi:excisionase family DNA binding protein